LTGTTKVEALTVRDVRFPTSLSHAGSDAMNPAPDYSAAYLTLLGDDGSAGYASVFTLGAGNDVQLAAIAALAPFLIGMDLDEMLDDLGSAARRLVYESHLRWLGPEKGVMHMAIGAVVNALFDLAARRAGVPLWRYLAGLSPEELCGLVDFRYIEDALRPDEALDLLRVGAEGKDARIAELEADGYPAYTTAPGWLGYSDARLIELCQLARRDGFAQVKIKVGGSLRDDLRRCRLAREAIGDEVALAIDANQVWDVAAAIDQLRHFEQFGIAWIEEPTSPDDILGLARVRSAIRPVPVATGENVANRIVFKQLLQAQAIDVMQIDACRVAGVGENIANLLLAAKFGIPVCPHAGGVGLCEIVQHLSFFDYAALSGTQAGRFIEWIDNHHEHFVAPASVAAGRYLAPVVAGASTEMLPESVAEYAYPHGPVWSGRVTSAGTS
jgi:L-fuconate dehydratase